MSPRTQSTLDFTAHRHPVLAVPCADCGAKAGSWCRRPSGHRAADFHKRRRRDADQAFIRAYGPTAGIERLPGNAGWRIVIPPPNA
jgi:hypothetical protein